MDIVRFYLSLVINTFYYVVLAITQFISVLSLCSTHFIWFYIQYSRKHFFARPSTVLGNSLSYSVRDQYLISYLVASYLFYFFSALDNNWFIKIYCLVCTSASLGNLIISVTCLVVGLPVIVSDGVIRVVSWKVSQALRNSLRLLCC